MIHRYLMPFIRWWIRQLGELVSPRLLDVYLDLGEAAVLEITGNSFGLNVRRKGKLARVAEGTLPDLAHALASLPDLPQLRLLQVPPEQVLRKTVSLPVATRRDLRTVLGFEIDRETPFEQAEVYWNYALAGPRPENGKLAIDLVVVPRRVGDALAQTARTAGFAASALEVANENRRPTLLWLETPNILQFYRPSPRLKPYRALAYGLCAALVLMPFAIQQARSFLADRTIAALEPQAHAASALNQAANRRMAALAFMGNREKGSALEILLAATRAIPDDTFLTAFSVQDGKVTMAGSSEAAGKLITVLAQSSAFREPVFDSAVLQDDGGDLEKFTISARLAAAGTP